MHTHILNNNNNTKKKKCEMTQAEHDDKVSVYYYYYYFISKEVAEGVKRNKIKSFSLFYVYLISFICLFDFFPFLNVTF